MKQHWSRELWSLWWLDRGTNRKRVSFAADRDTLLSRLARVWHDGCDAALYNPAGDRVPLSAPEEKKRKGKSKGKSKGKDRADVLPAAA